MSKSLDAVLAPALHERRAQQLFRSRHTLTSAQGPEIRVNGKPYLSFCSNDYLGLANHPAVIEASQRALRDYGLGSGASHLVTGHSHYHHELEEALAAWTGRPRALLFSSGYSANMGAIAALVGAGDAIFEDRLNHASLLDGGLLSGAKFQRFAHNDMALLAARLERTTATRKLIAVDGVFSMDGDCTPLPELCRLAKEYHAWVMVDDAHGLGVLGNTGAGSCEQFGMGLDDVPILMGTLGKALGGSGAFIAGSDALIETLIQFARPYIYTTALPPAIAAGVLAAIGVIQAEPERRQHLHALSQQLQQGLVDLGLRSTIAPVGAPLTAIQPVILGSATRALLAADRLAEKGIRVTPIRPPTVPAHTARLRITLSAAHTADQVAHLVDALGQVLRELPDD